MFNVNRLTDSEEVIREHLRSLRQREAALNAMEKENTELHDKVNLLVQEKATITRELEKVKVSTLIMWFFYQSGQLFFVEYYQPQIHPKGKPFFRLQVYQKF